MTKFESLCTEYRENKRLIEELESLNNGIKAAILEIMDGLETMTQGASKATNQTITSVRLDSTAIKKNLPDVYSKYSKNISYKRFIVA